MLLNMKTLLTICVCFAVVGCTNTTKTNVASNDSTTKASTAMCSDGCIATNKSGVLTCKLTSAELQQCKATVLASLRKQMLERKELPNGYAFKFSGNDQTVDELTSFIKTERQCCDFFTFNLSVSGDGSEAWLQLTGPEGSKDFITPELSL